MSEIDTATLPGDTAVTLPLLPDTATLPGDTAVTLPLLPDQPPQDDPAVTLPLLPDHPPQDDPATKPVKPAKARDIAGLVLVDVPAHGLKCGDYVTLPAATAKGLQASGEFDPQAPRPE